MSPPANACGLLITVGQHVRLDRLGPYAAAIAPIYKRFGGHYLGIGGPGRGVAALTPDAPPLSLMVARFPTLDAVQGFWWSPEYRAAVPLRAGCGQFDVVALAGDAPPEPPDALWIALDPAAAAPGALADAEGEAILVLEGARPARRLQVTTKPPPEAAGGHIYRLAGARP